MTTEQKYYKAVVIDYLVENIDHLLEAEELRSGLILGPVFGAIDAIGGAVYGYDEKVGTRFKGVLEEFLGYSRQESIYLYDSVRCGLIHQGTAKTGLKFFSNHEDFERPHAIYKHDDWLILDCVKLARDSSAAAKSIWEDDRQRIQSFPEPKDAGFEALSTDSSLPRLEGYDALFQAFVEDKFGSNSGFDHDQHFNIDLTLPRQGEQDAAPQIRPRW